MDLIEELLQIAGVPFGEVSNVNLLNERLYPEIENSTYNKILDYTSSTGRANAITKWVSEMFLNKKLDSNFWIDGKETINKYLSLLQAGKVAPINKYSSYKELELSVNEPGVLTNKERKREAGREAIDLGSVAGYTLYEIQSYAASKKYGAKTRWCTTEKDDEYYYNKHCTKTMNDGFRKLIYAINPFAEIEQKYALNILRVIPKPIYIFEVMVYDQMDKLVGSYLCRNDLNMYTRKNNSYNDNDVVDKLIDWAIIKYSLFKEIGEREVKQHIKEAVAYAGSRRNYDVPSLDAIGSGEGYQAHGWGLYYALNPDIAEIYRKTFTETPYENIWEVDGEDLTEFLGDLLNTDTKYMFDNVFKRAQALDTSTVRDNLLISLYDAYQFYANRYRNGHRSLFNPETEPYHNPMDKELAKEALEKRDYVATLRPVDFSIGVGVVHKVEIPDLKFLLDEQEKIGQQADYIQQRLSQILKDLNTGNLKDYSELSGKEFYKLLSDKLGTPKKASFLLYKYGIKGIHYVGAEDGECVVIFNPEDLRVLKRFYGGNGIEMERIGG